MKTRKTTRFILYAVIILISCILCSSAYAVVDITPESFTAIARSDHVQVSWETTAENGTTGFYVFRSTNRNDGYEQVIGEDGVFVPSKTTDPPAFSYTYNFKDYSVDRTTTTTYYYKLEEEDEFPATENNIYGPTDPVTFPPIDSGGTADSGGGCFIITAMNCDP